MILKPNLLTYKLELDLLSRCRKIFCYYSCCKLNTTHRSGDFVLDNKVGFVPSPFCHGGYIGFYNSSRFNRLQSFIPIFNESFKCSRRDICILTHVYWIPCKFGIQCALMYFQRSQLSVLAVLIGKHHPNITSKSGSYRNGFTFLGVFCCASMILTWIDILWVEPHYFSKIGRSFSEILVILGFIIILWLPDFVIYSVYGVHCLQSTKGIYLLQYQITYSQFLSFLINFLSLHWLSHKRGSSNSSWEFRKAKMPPCYAISTTRRSKVSGSQKWQKLIMWAVFSFVESGVCGVGWKRQDGASSEQECIHYFAWNE